MLDEGEQVNVFGPHHARCAERVFRGFLAVEVGGYDSGDGVAEHGEPLAPLSPVPVSFVCHERKRRNGRVLLRYRGVNS